MTPKGAAVLPRPFCCHFAFCRGRFAALFAFWRGRFAAIFSTLARLFCRGRFAALFLLFSFPLSPSSCSPRPATFCELLPAPMVTFCELLPVPPPRAKFTFCQLLPAPRFGKVGILSTFGDTLRTLCQPPVNFLPPFARARLGKVGILSTFGDTLRTCGAPFVTFCHHFCRISVLLQTLTLHPRVYESGGGNAKNSPFPLPNIKKRGKRPAVCAPMSAAFFVSCARR